MRRQPQLKIRGSQISFSKQNLSSINRAPKGSPLPPLARVMLNLAFDPSKVDLSDPDALAALTDEQFAEVTKHNASPQPEPAPGTPDSDTDAAAKAAAAEKAAAGKYAGKYATTDDLVKGVTEIAKKVGVDVTAFVEAAKESKEFKSLESLYKRMEKTLGEKGAVTTGSQGDPAKPPATGTADADTFDPANPDVANAIDKLTLQQLAGSALSTRLQSKGLAMPTNMEEFDELAEKSPYFAMEVKQAYEALYRSNTEQAKGFFEAKRTVEGANAGVVATDTQSLKALATEQGFTLSDVEVEAAKTAALANPNSYETRYGHKFLRPNAVRDHFLVNALPAKLGEIKIAQQAAGRTQAVADLERAKNKEVGGIGAAKLNTRTRVAGKMPDVTNPDVLATMPDEILNYVGGPEAYYLSKGFTK